MIEYRLIMVVLTMLCARCAADDLVAGGRRDHDQPRRRRRPCGYRWREAGRELRFGHDMRGVDARGVGRRTVPTLLRLWNGSVRPKMGNELGMIFTG